MSRSEEKNVSAVNGRGDAAVAPEDDSGTNLPDGLRSRVRGFESRRGHRRGHPGNTVLTWIDSLVNGFGLGTAWERFEIDGGSSGIRQRPRHSPRPADP
jgi:hypothetical protein